MSAKKRLPVVLTSYEQLALMKQPNPRAPTGLRNLCIISLMLKTGLRVNEVINLAEEDIDWDSGKIHVKESGAACERVLWVGKDELEILNSWRCIKPAQSDGLFTTLDGSRLKDRYIREMIKRLSRKAGIRKDVYPHLLRYTFAVDFMRETKDIHLLQNALGHREAAATQVYAKLLFDELKEPCFSDTAVRRSGMPVSNGQQRFSIVEKDDPHSSAEPEEINEITSSGSGPADPGSMDNGKGSLAPMISDPGCKPHSGEETKPEESISRQENRELSPKTTASSHSENEKVGERIRIPAIKCSQCSYILRFQGDCPQCGATFESIMRHWGKNV
jgi:hypothetical protein